MAGAQSTLNWTHHKLSCGMLNQKKEKQPEERKLNVKWCECILFWMLGVWVCVRTYLAVHLNRQFLWWKKTENGGVTDCSSQADKIFILFTGNRVWNFDEEQFASLDDYEEVGFVLCHRKANARTLLLQKTCPPHHQPAPSLSSLPFALLAPFISTSASDYSSLVLWARAPAGSPFHQALPWS